MQKKILVNLLIVSVFGIVLATSSVFIIQTIMAHNAAEITFTTRLNDVAQRIKRNEMQISELTEAIKEDYISRARALAMMIELEPGIINDREKLNEVTVALNVDEVHIIDENGILWWGTQPQYYGLDFASTEQTRQFLAILDDPSLEIAQDPMPNGSADITRQYAAVSLRNQKGIAQIGMVPERLEEALKNNQICEVLNEIPVGDTGYVFSADPETGFVTSHPNRNLVGHPTFEPIGDSGVLLIDRQRVRYNSRIIGNHLVVAVLPLSELYAQRAMYTGIFMGFSVAYFAILCYIVSRNIKKNVIRGISDIAETLDNISAGDLDVTVAVSSSIEFERLSTGINHMLASIKAKMMEIASMTDEIRRFGAIVAIADAGIIVKDEKGIVQEWNIGAENILGYKPEEIVGKSTKHYAPDISHTGIDEIDEGLGRGEHFAHLEVVRKHKNGTLIDCSASYTPIVDENGNVTGSVAIFHDISDKKRIEKELHEAVLMAEQANSAKTSFLANMSHEIRTPMNGIIGFSELALDDADVSAKTKDFLDKIKVSAEGLLKIINDVLDISKIEAGKMELESIQFSLHEVFTLCETISSLKAEEKGIVLYLYAEPNIGKMLVGDPTKLRQILLNLLSNAIKFTNKGMVKLMATIEEQRSDSATIRFEIKDNGIGLTPEQVKKVLEPFTQADESTTRKYGGTGLGLAISKNLIELMGGELTVDSTPGVGSKFTFSLIFKTDEMSEQAFIPARQFGRELKKPEFSGEVLVCEDNSINQQVIQGHLSKIGLKTTLAENGELGVEAVKKRMGNPFDLIFMDIHMPVMDGLEASKQLTGMGVKTPIIALTANAMSNDRETYLDNGMSDYLAKPFTARELWECLLRHLTPIGEVTVEAEIPADNALSDEQIIDRRKGIELSGNDEGLYDELLARFIRENANVLDNIKSAIDIGETAQAHRLAHTLKGLAGTLGMIRLRNAALSVERSLADGVPAVTAEQMSALEDELDMILFEFSSLAEKGTETNKPVGKIDIEKAAGLLDKLKPLLNDFSMDSLDYTCEVEDVFSPFGDISKTLAAQIGDCDFSAALETVAQIEGLIRCE